MSCYLDSFTRLSPHALTRAFRTHADDRDIEMRSDQLYDDVEDPFAMLTKSARKTHKTHKTRASCEIAKAVSN